VTEAAVDQRVERVLAIDLGLRCGVAVWTSEGRLETWRSTHFANAGQARRVVDGLVDEVDGLVELVLEGDRLLARPWQRAADRRNVLHRLVQANVWRTHILYPREQRTGRLAKDAADRLARAAIDRFADHRTAALRHDAAEAILIGAWAAHMRRWIPDPLRALR
jgi:hypothetical protein